ncbi:MAG: hypothetical protein U0625_09830 [Phycisphaerales bacterium]
MEPINHADSPWLDVIAAFDTEKLLPMAPEIVLLSVKSCPADQMRAAEVLGGVARVREVDFGCPGCDWSNVTEGIEGLMLKWADDPVAHDPRHVGYLIGVAQFLHQSGHGRGLHFSQPADLTIPLAWAATLEGPIARDAVHRALLEARPVTLDDDWFDRCLVRAMASWLSSDSDSSRSIALVGAAGCLRLSGASPYSSYLAELARLATPDVAGFFRDYAKELLEESQ